MAKLRPASLFLRPLDFFSVFCRPNFSLKSTYLQIISIKWPQYGHKNFFCFAVIQILLDRKLRLLVKINFSIWPTGQKSLATLVLENCFSTFLQFAAPYLTFENWRNPQYCDKKILRCFDNFKPQISTGQDKLLNKGKGSARLLFKSLPWSNLDA